MAESYQSGSFWRQQYALIGTMNDLHIVRWLLNLANFALQDGVSSWARYNLRKTVCAAVRRFPGACAATILTMGADSVRDVAWSGIVLDPVIMKTFRLKVTGIDLNRIEALEAAAKLRKGQ